MMPRGVAETKSGSARTRGPRVAVPEPLASNVNLRRPDSWEVASAPSSNAAVVSCSPAPSDEPPSVEGALMLRTVWPDMSDERSVSLFHKGVKGQWAADTFDWSKDVGM